MALKVQGPEGFVFSKSLWQSSPLLPSAPLSHLSLFLLFLLVSSKSDQSLSPVGGQQGQGHTAERQRQAALWGGRAAFWNLHWVDPGFLWVGWSREVDVRHAVGALAAAAALLPAAAILIYKHTNKRILLINRRWWWGWEFVIIYINIWLYYY